MAFFTKEVYDKKAAYAAQRMEENKENNRIGNADHEALSDICSMRHQLHCMDGKAGYCQEMQDADIITGMLNIDDEHSFYQIIFNLDLKIKAKEVVLGRLNQLYNEYMRMDNDAYDEDMPENENERHQHIDNHIQEYADLFEKVNCTIEKFLSEVDLEFESDYCPSGASRIF
jgi:hypothetical protein